MLVTGVLSRQDIRPIRPEELPIYRTWSVKAKFLDAILTRFMQAVV